MKITMYELLGSIKDGKAPKRIKEIFKDGSKKEYILDKDGWYMTKDETTRMNIFKPERLNDEVEIIEEKENNEIKKLNLQAFRDSDTPAQIFKIANKVDELIDVINETGGKNEN